LSLASTCFWISTTCVAYAYVIYPLAIYTLARLRGPRSTNTTPAPTSISILIPARNEQDTIARRIIEFHELIKRANVTAEIILISDGSTDATAKIARDHGATVLDLPQNKGKAAALTQAAAVATGEILVLADARQRWHTDALKLLLENFRDRSIGAATGDLILESSQGVTAGVGLYWRYERWLRKNEGQVASTVGVTGAIAAVRRNLFTPIPAGTILDDVYWPLCVAMKNHRIVHDPRAIAYDRLPDRTRDEFRRKVRTLTGNFQLLVRLPQALLPWRNPIWFQLISHKLLRLLVPWLLVVILLTNISLRHHCFYQLTLIAQLLFYAIALTGIFTQAKLRLTNAAASFVLLNAAAWTAFWVFITGRSNRAWTKVTYATS
jgi:poly-beta-1,6-N-acetyl-D-glucosamine synthase